MLTRSTGEKIFNVFNLLFFFLFGCLIMVPILFVLKNSFDISLAGEINLSLWPKTWSLIYYEMVVKDESVYRPFMNSAFITIVGTSGALLVNSIGAYTLSKRELPGSGIFVYFLVIFPMLFSGGTVPTFLLMRSLGFIDKFSALIVPALASGWNMILIRNFYQAIPKSLSESARMDGAQEFTVFTKIILPLSKPVLAAIGLFTGVGFWNTFMAAIIYMRDPKKYTFPVKLREMISLQSDRSTQDYEAMLLAMGLDPSEVAFDSDGISAAMMVVSMLPILCVYPYLQKHFASGLMVGSIKG